MRISIATVAALAFASSGAIACPIVATDLSQRFEALAGGQLVSTSDLVDGRSKEPIRRYVMAFDDGSLVVVEQKHCEIENLTATLFSTEAAPDQKAVSHLADSLAASDVWQREFGDSGRVSLEGVFRSDRMMAGLSDGANFEMSLDDSLTSQSPAELALIYNDLSADADSFRSMVSIYVGIGGL